MLIYWLCIICLCTSAYQHLEKESNVRQMLDYDLFFIMHPDGDVQFSHEKGSPSAGVKPCPFVSAKYHVQCISMMSWCKSENQLQQ